ncbi:alpha/beta hydrolase [Yinghuangia aomiensis]
MWSWAADCAAPGPDRAYPLDAVKLPNLLLVSTTRDPATPNVAAARLKRQLPDAALVTYNGDGHVAFYRRNPCVDRATSSYLLTGAATDTTCS